VQPVDREQLTTWTAETRRVGYERRDWPTVRRLGGLCVGLLASGLIADLTKAPRAFRIGCRAGAGISGAAMLVWMYDRRRFVTSRAASVDTSMLAPNEAGPVSPGQSPTDS
jgi:hypothetical protein